MSLLSSTSITSLFTRWSSLSTKMEALFSFRLSSEISMQSQVRPSISPIRSEQAKDKLMANARISSSHTSRACIRVSAVHISRFWCSSFGSVALRTGFLVINSHFTAWLKALLKNLWISLTVCTVRYSFLGFLFCTTLVLTFRRLW